jgi:hypothetical protein
MLSSQIPLSFPKAVQRKSEQRTLLEDGSNVVKRLGGSGHTLGFEAGDVAINADKSL